MLASKAINNREKLMRFLIKKTILSFLAATLFTFYIQPLSAQHLTSIEKKAFVIREDSLKPFANNIVLDEDAGKRLKSDSIFTRTLVRALKIKNSFYFPFGRTFNLGFHLFYIIPDLQG